MIAAPSPKRGQPASKRTARAFDIVRHAALLTLVGLTFYPLATMLSASVKDLDQVAATPWGLALPLHWENYSAAWSRVGPYIGNSLIVSGASCIGVIVLASVVSYIFARYDFVGRSALFYAIIAAIMVPGIATLVPRFVLISQLHLINTRWALILPYIAGGQAVGIILLRGFFAAIPEELFEAARLDGAGHMTLLTRLALPLAQPILSTLAIVDILETWNEVIWPYLTIDSEALKTIPVGLLSFALSDGADWGPLMAAYTLASLPLLALFAIANRYFLEPRDILVRTPLWAGG